MEFTDEGVKSVLNTQSLFAIARESKKTFVEVKASSHFCGAQVVKTKKNWHWVLLVLNIFLPGSGTIMNGICCFSEKQQKI